MFTWICPQCGREVPPAYTECPDCSRKTDEAAAPPAEPVAAPPPPPPPPPPPTLPLRPTAPVPTVPTPTAAPPPPPLPSRYNVPPPAPSRGLPTWLLTIVFTLAFVGIGAGVYWLIQYLKHPESSAPAAASSAPLETPSKAGGKPHPLQKFIEVTGVRLYQNAKKKTEARFLIVNHSDGEIAELAGTVEIRGRTAREAEEPVGAIAFKATNIGPQEAKEVTAPVDTKLRVYELPDWQNIDARLRITAP